MYDKCIYMTCGSVAYLPQLNNRGMRLCFCYFAVLTLSLKINIKGPCRNDQTSIISATGGNNLNCPS